MSKSRSSTVDGLEGRVGVKNGKKYGTGSSRSTTEDEHMLFLLPAMNHNVYEGPLYNSTTLEDMTDPFPETYEGSKYTYCQVTVIS